MQYDPALGMYCAKFAWPPSEHGFDLIPPIPSPVPLGVFHFAHTSTLPLPAEKRGQARYYEQYAECFSDSPSFASAAMERALRLRLVVNGASSREARRGAVRAIDFYLLAGDDKGAERVRSLADE